MNPNTVKRAAVTPPTQPQHARVVIIGGGVMGCSLLYHLSRLGWQDLLLLEKNQLTAGSTWHAAGLCTHYAHNLTIMQLRAHSVHLYRSELPQETGHAVGFHASGALRITTSKDRLDEFCHVQALGKFAGFDFNILTPAELKQLYPLVQTDGLLAAIHEPLDGYVDPSQATHAMAAAARQRGATILCNTPVTDLQARRAAWAVTTPHGVINAEHIVNAAGTWGREIGHLMGLDLPLVPLLHQYIVTDRIPAFAAHAELPFIRDPEQSWYLRQEGDGVILGPYEKQPQAWGVDGIPPDFGMQLLPPDLERVESIAADCIARVPAVAAGGVKSVINGPITFTPDANPLIGPAFGCQRAWLLTGSSMGVMEGGGAGQFLAHWMDAGEPPQDASPVDSRRFGDYADRAYRLAKAKECFAAQFAIHYPFEQRAAARGQRKTPLYARLKQLGAVFGSINGWECANWYARAGTTAATIDSFRRTNWFDAVAAECRAAATRVALADLSMLAKFTLSGRSAAEFIASLGANHPPRRDLDITLCHVLSPRGGVLAEFSVTRLAPDRFYLVSAAAAERHDHDLLRQRAAAYPDLRLDNHTERRGVISIMGPHAAALLSELSDAAFDQTAFAWRTAQNLSLAGHPVLALRLSYIGESGWELHHDVQHTTALFESLYKHGQAYQLGLYGTFSMNSMRLEKGYRAYGLDLSSERTPLEAGLHAFVKPYARQPAHASTAAAARAFIGRDALLQRQAAPAHWQMQLLELAPTEHNADPFYAHPVIQDQRPIGLVTSGAYGHRTNKPLALAYFQHPPTASPLSVLILGHPVAARRLDQVPYDPHNLILKG